MCCSQFMLIFFSLSLAVSLSHMRVCVCVSVHGVYFGMACFTFPFTCCPLSVCRRNCLANKTHMHILLCCRQLAEISLKHEQQLSYVTFFWSTFRCWIASRKMKPMKPIAGFQAICWLSRLLNNDCQNPHMHHQNCLKTAATTIFGI